MSTKNLDYPLMNTYRLDKYKRYDVFLPGYDKTKLSAKIKDNFLTIEGVMEVGYLPDSIIEYPIAPFLRKLRVPDRVTNMHIDARYDNGILEIMVPIESPAIESKEVSIR